MQTPSPPVQPRYPLVMDVHHLPSAALCMILLTACSLVPEGADRFYSLGAGHAGEELAIAGQMGFYGSPDGARLQDRLGYYGSFGWDLLALDTSPTDLTDLVPDTGVSGDVLRTVQTEDVWAAIGGTCRVSERLGLRFGMTAGWLLESRIFDPDLGPLIGGPSNPYLVVTKDEFVFGTEVGIDLIHSNGSGLAPSITYASGPKALILMLSFWH